MVRKIRILLYVPVETEVQVTKIIGGGKLTQEIQKQGIKVGTKLRVLSRDHFIQVAIRTSDWLWTGREILLSKAEANRIGVRYRF